MADHFAGDQLKTFIDKLVRFIHSGCASGILNHTLSSSDNGKKFHNSWSHSKHCQSVRKKHNNGKIYGKHDSS
jgi:hypothetical protein